MTVQSASSYCTYREPMGGYEAYWQPKADPDGLMRVRLTDDERRHYLQEDVGAELAFFKAAPSGRILDYGAGPGWFLEALPEDYDKYAVEIGDALQILFSKHIRATDTVDAYDDDWFDYVFCHHVIEHLPDPVSAVMQMYRVLRDRGWLVLGTPDFDSPCARRFGSNYRMLHDPTHCSLFTMDSVTRLLLDVGFQIVHLILPFPQRFRTSDTFSRWEDTDRVSPPWPGNWMTFFARKPI